MIADNRLTENSVWDDRLLAEKRGIPLMKLATENRRGRAGFRRDAQEIQKDARRRPKGSAPSSINNLGRQS
jgi:hypothetical protein